MSYYTIAWIIWIVAFFLIEGEALFSPAPHTNTLSAHLWCWFSMRGKSRWWALRRAALFVGMIWLFIHLTLHWGVLFRWSKYL